MKKIKYPKTKKWLNSKLLLAIGLMIFIFVLTNFIKGWKKAQEIKKDFNDLSQEIQSLEENNLQLSELIKYLNSTAFIEEKARTDLGLKKEGEKAIIISNLSSTIQPQLPVDKTGKDSKNVFNYQKWWYYFFTKS